jgi:hypothetical protein
VFFALRLRIIKRTHWTDIQTMNNTLSKHQTAFFVWHGFQPAKEWDKLKGLMKIFGAYLEGPLPSPVSNT